MSWTCCSYTPCTSTAGPSSAAGWAVAGSNNRIVGRVHGVARHGLAGCQVWDLLTEGVTGGPRPPDPPAPIIESWVGCMAMRGMVLQGVKSGTQYDLATVDSLATVYGLAHGTA